MSFFSWIRRLGLASPPRGTAKKSPRPRKRRGLGLEVLEDRLAPAVLTVNSFFDVVAADSTLTLREAVAVANSNSTAGLSAAEQALVSGTLGADTIQFASDVNFIALESAQLQLNDAQKTTINGGSGVTIRRSSAVGTPDFRILNVAPGATVDLTALTLTNGKSNFGGGIVNFGTLTVSNSTLSGNSASLSGGGIINGGTLTVSNSTLSGNSASFEGGGISNFVTLTVTDSTLTGNKGNGGGIRAAGLETLNNTIVAGNLNAAGTSPNDIAVGPIETANNNLIGDAGTAGGISNGINGNIVGNNGSGTLNITTVLVTTLADNGGPTRTHALVQNSKAIGGGSEAVAGFSRYDQREAARDAGAPDIGAYEVQHPLAPVGTPSTYAATFLPKPSASANEAFVKGLYQSTLLRAADAGGLASWLNFLANGASRAFVANGFVNSTENRNNQVTFFYRYFLNREPDAPGLEGWVSLLQSGVDEGNVMRGFLLSQEFTGQNNNASFVNLLYFALLGRQADTGGFNHWKGHLDAGTMSRDQVGEGFLRSLESIQRVVRADFASYLKRQADTVGLNTMTNLLTTGTTFGGVAIVILASDEFFINAGQHVT